MVQPARHADIERVKMEGTFDEVRISPLGRQSYGALVTHIIEPAGVLL